MKIRTTEKENEMQGRTYIGQMSFGAYGTENVYGTIDEIKDAAWGEGAPLLWIYHPSGGVTTVGHYVWDEEKPLNYRRINRSRYDQEIGRIRQATRAEKRQAA